MIQTLFAGFLASIPCVPHASGATTSFPFYQIDFESPDSIVAATPSSHSFSSVVFGNIASGVFPGTDSRAAVFNTTGSTDTQFFYDQAQLDFYSTGAVHRLSVDLYLTHILGTQNHFVITFDTPSVQNIEFNPDGTIGRTDYRIPSMGYFQEDTPLHLEAIGDTINHLLTVTLNGVLLSSSPYNSTSSGLSSVRLTLGAITSLDPNDPRTTVYVDNLLVTVPEPSAVLLAASSLMALVLRRKRSLAPRPFFAFFH